MPTMNDALRATLRGASEDQVLTTITRSVLFDPKFRGFQVEVEPWTPRPYDGKFHPSTHATWTARQLYYYLKVPNLLEVEQMSLTSVLAITQGKFFHDFLQRLWLRHGVLQVSELLLNDEMHNRTGHMDGLLITQEGLEIKTMNDFKLPKMTDAEALRELKPEYYAQAQEYLDMSELTQMRYFIIGTSYPYPMREFVVPFDEPFQIAQRQKYREALDMAAGDQAPPVCCKIRSATASSCVARRACEIGRAS